jgi:tryptophan halogenase
MPEGNHPIADIPSREELSEYLDIMARLIRREADQMPGHAEFIARHCAAPVAAEAAQACAG